MNIKTPPGFDKLNSLSNRLDLDVNVIGIVTDFLPPSRSNGTDWMCTFSITDTSINGEQKVRFFRPTEPEMPAIKGIGDMVILRRAKVKEWSGMSLLISSRSTSWIVFQADSIPAEPPRNNIQINHVKDPRASAPTPSEMLYAISLCNSQDANILSRSAKLSDEPTLPSSTNSTALASGPRQKFSLVKDVKIDTFYDLVGQVVKLYPNNDRVELYITDYTSNPLLFPYEWGREVENRSEGDGDIDIYGSRSLRRKWQGPYGKMTLAVTLWSPHSYFAQSNVKENDFVHLRNVHIKYSKDAKAEGVLHTDKRYPDRIDVTLLKDQQDDRVKDVLRRKRDYMKKFNVQSEEFVGEVRGQKRNQTEDGAGKLSKGQAKRIRKQQREREQEEKNKKQGKSLNAQDGPQDENQLKAAVFPKLELNKNISCSHPSVPPRTLSAILSRDDTHAYTTPNGKPCTLPFQNINSRATVGVVDFFPPKLEDFAVPHYVTEFSALSDEDSTTSSTSNDNNSSSSCTTSQHQHQTQRREKNWEWRFCLLLEDASSLSRQKSEDRTRMKAYLTGQDAEFLLKMDAVDLRQDPQALSQLREKLFILWGDLEERKSKSSRQERALKMKECNRNSLAEGEGAGEGGAPRRGQEEENRCVGGKAAPRARPFQCCIKEYGVQDRSRRKCEVDETGNGDDGEIVAWERTFAMFGTTIM